MRLTYVLLASCYTAAAAPAPASYPPTITQLRAAERTRLVDDLRAHAAYKLDTVRVSSFGDVDIYSADPALVGQRQDHGAFDANDITRLERFVADNATALHVRDAAKLHYDVAGPSMTAIETTPDSTTTISIERSWYSSSDHKVWAIVRATQRRVAPAMPATAKVEAALRARLVGAKFDRVEHFNAHPCDPVGPVDTCPRAYDARTRVTIAAADVVIGFGAIELVRQRGGGLETHLIGCATLARPAPVQAQSNATFASGGVRFEPVGGGMALPYAVDVVTGEDLTAQLHAHGGIGCAAQVTGAGYDTGELLE